MENRLSFYPTEKPHVRIDFCYLQRMKISKIAVSIATALALTVGGVFAASAQPSGTKDWMVIGLDAVDTEKGYKFVNPTSEEVSCDLDFSERNIIEPIFEPWTKPGITYEEAESQSEAARTEFARIKARNLIAQWGGTSESYIAPGETRYFSLKGWGADALPGNAISLICRQQDGYKVILAGYGIAKQALSVRSSLSPVTSAPNYTETVTATVTATPPALTTVTETAEPMTSTVRETATITAHATVTKEPSPLTTTVRETAITTVTAKPKKPAPETTTVYEPVTTTVPAKEPQPVTTTVRKTATTTVTAKPKEPTPVTTTVRETVTKEVPTTVVKTVAPTATVKSPSTEELIGWIIGLIAALGLGGVAGFIVNNVNLLPH